MRIRIVQISLFTMSLLLSFLGSCSGVTDYESAVEQEQDIILNISTRTGENSLTQDGTDEENKITSLLAIVYNVQSISGQVLCNEQIAFQHFAGSHKVITLKVPKHDQMRVLLIANGKDAWKTDLQGRTAEEVKNVIVNHQVSDLSKDVPFLMFSESRTIDGKTDQNMTVSLKRNLARVDLDVTCTFSTIPGMSTGDKIELSTACMYRMASTSGLSNPIRNLNIASNSMNGNIIKLEKNINYQPDEVGFSLGNSESPYLTFYVPEYYLTDINAYTYIYITGKYIPADKNKKELNVAYTIPVGNNITSNKISGSEKFTAEDLRIERNNLYRMKGTLKTVQQINDIHVDVLPWTKENVKGTITIPQPAKLNVSDLKVNLATTDDTVSIQFWSNQASKDVRVLADMQVKTKDTNTTEKVNNIFSNLADEVNGITRPSNLLFKNGETIDGQWSQWGSMRLTFLKGKATENTTYIITLAAGTLYRTIEVTAKNPDIIKNKQ